MTTVSRKLFELCLWGIRKGAQGLGRKGNLIIAELAEKLAPTIDVPLETGMLKMYCPGRLPVWRAESFLSKEPETIEWVDSFEGNSVFWDIGANVGVFSLYSALRHQVKVLAFEPAAANYYVLNSNIRLNQLDNKISAFCLAFNKNTCLDSLFLSSVEFGSALHTFSKSNDLNEKPTVPKQKQGMIGFSIDDFIERFNPFFPNYIKIDVDGIEGEIVDGALATLADDRMKSILIELDTKNSIESDRIIQVIEQAGLTLERRQHAPQFDQGEYSSIYNHIFRR
jgi:FkbM family methyltransferase